MEDVAISITLSRGATATPSPVVVVVLEHRLDRGWLTGVEEEIVGRRLMAVFQIRVADWVCMDNFTARLNTS
jgi:hypothetical protein